jgi:ATP-dependent Lhr-like helicase
MASHAHSSLKWAHPLVQEWFAARFSAPTEPQVDGWPHILAGRATLICAPTGSGKTLAAFLVCIDKLVRLAAQGRLENRTHVVYVSPLKALSNDIHKNLEVPLKEILELAGKRGITMPEIRIALRTGDTLPNERASMLKHPPHILVTTPESLYIMLTAQKSRLILKDVTTVIVDEIHAVADDKRGSHLALSLERLQALCEATPVRIGLSATQKPLELVARFLVGGGRPLPDIVNVGHRRRMDVQVVSLAQPLGPVASNEMWDEIYDKTVEYTKTHRSVLVFVNTRKFAERMAFRLSERLGEDAVAAHHGSLSRKLRLNAEHRLKTGQLKVLVATASLELGIDIGDIDLVCLVNSPRSIATALQRIGRAGHWHGALPKGRIFATTRDDLIECAALVKSINEGDLDELHIPECSLDILAQQIVAACAAEDYNEDDLFALMTAAYPYRQLSRDDFERVLHMLTEGFEGRSAKFGAYLQRDRVNGRVRARRGARLAAVTNGGAIPETGAFAMVAEPEGINVGTLDEDFAVESNAGDIILLGNTSWRIRRVEAARGRVLVEDAHGLPPTVPFWRGEAPGRTPELSKQVASVRSSISDFLPDVGPGATLTPNPQVQPALKWLAEKCGLDKAAGEQAIEYVLEGRSILGAVPTQQTIIAERFFDESGGMQLVVHAPFGARINKAWGLALRKRFCRSFNLELQAAATDDGLNIALSEKHSFPLADIFFWLHPNSLREVLEQAVFATPIFGSRWRWDATRALALLRFSGGKKIPPQLQRMRAEDLLATVFPQAAACQDNIEGDRDIPQHPIVDEVMKDIMTEALDLDGLVKVLRAIEKQEIKCIAIDTPMPSQFSHEILNANPYAYLDDAPLEERRARAVEMRRTLPPSVLEEVGRLDPEAIARVSDEAWPDVRDRDDLHDALLTLIALPQRLPHGVVEQPADVWRNYFEELCIDGRAATALIKERTYWVCAERKREFELIFPDAVWSQRMKDLPCQIEDRAQAIAMMMRGWMMHSGPVTAPALAQRLGVPVEDMDAALLTLESAGAVLRGSFTSVAPGVVEWCERRLLARIHKLTVGKLRQQIEPVTAAQFMRWLTHWQHVAGGTQVSGERGLLMVLEQLQGFEAPANAWESQILRKRMRNYDPADLDRLCLTGAVGWGRLSPHPSVVAADASSPADIVLVDAPRRRVVPTSVAPITFFVRSQSEWMAPHQALLEDGSILSRVARDICAYLRSKGASFFADIVRATGFLKSEVETALWELVTAGLVTADGFDNLRSLIDRRRRAGQGRARCQRPRDSTGRWSLLHHEGAASQTRTEAVCFMLLNRYGVVFRDLLARESLTLTWRELLISLRRLEDRGEIRGGRFVSGFVGEQFALPVAVESLRSMRNQPPSHDTVVVSAADPLNLVGYLVPGQKVSPLSGHSIAITDGVVTQLQGAQLRSAISD